MSLTASIVTHNTPKVQLETALDCLLRSGVERIYVVDNSESDSLKEIAGKDGRIVYRHVANNGFGAGHNVALREILETNSASDDFHIVMNADINWEGDVVSRLTDYLKTHPKTGMIMPKVFYPDGELQYSFRMLPTPFDVFAKRFLPQKWTNSMMERYLLAIHDHDKPLNCPYLLGSFLMFRNSALKECGLFDERFFMYPEDIDITRRIHEKWETLYWPSCSIIHEHQASSRKSMKMLRIHIVNMIRYFNKWGWLHDPLRRKFNRKLLQEIAYIEKEKRPAGRG